MSSSLSGATSRCLLDLEGKTMTLGGVRVTWKPSRFHDRDMLIGYAGQLRLLDLQYDWTLTCYVPSDRGHQPKVPCQSEQEALRTADDMIRDFRLKLEAVASAVIR